MSQNVARCSVSLRPEVLAFLEEVITDPEAAEYGRSRSDLVNFCIAQYARRKGRDLNLSRPRSGHPAKNNAAWHLSPTIANQLFDVLMPRCSGPAFKVVST